MDSNQRPPGYEPGELPTAPPRDVNIISYKKGHCPGHNSKLSCFCRCKGTDFSQHIQILLIKIWKKHRKSPFFAQKWGCCAFFTAQFLHILAGMCNFALAMALIKTRNKLVDVARQLFAKRGLDNTTMNDIAAASGKGRRTLYTYFKSKEDIYFAVIEAEMERLLERMNEVAKTNLEPEDKLVELIYTQLNLIKEAVQRNGNLRADFFRIVAGGVRTGGFEIESIPLFVDILHFSLKGLEIPYIYGRLGQGVPRGMNRAIVQKMVHKLVARPERRQNLYL